MRAGNRIGADGAASLAPSLGRMAQLTSLDLSGTLRAIGGSWRCERVLANAGCAWMKLCVVGWGCCAWGCSGWWGLRGASRGVAVRAGNQIEAAGAASLAPSLGRMAQLTTLNLYGTLRASAGLVLFAGACKRRQCRDDATCCGLGEVVRGAAAGDGA